MFFKLIEIKRNAWLQSPSCPIKSLVDYMECRGMMRDAQIEAIKTYLFLKIGCHNKPLWKLFHDGILSSPESIALNGDERALLGNNTPALALMQYAALPNKSGKALAPELVKAIKTNPACVDYEKAFRDLFYGVDYPDYLFSLPMGAGKTYLMAAFIYLDLYFAQNEPSNPIFAHNFMILAPSGLKSSIIPSLKKIQNFDPSWVLPEPAASNIRRMIKFEVLDEQKSAKKSNRIKNPNAQKLNMHLATEGESLMGLVAVTNAEKVILDRLDKDTDSTAFSKEELDKDKVYPGGLCAKMAIYCGKIETLEERIFPLVSSILQSYHIDPGEAVLKYHDGNKQYPAPDGAEAAFAALDTAMSRIRVVLLVQIGKEGWDCRSLTGVILSQQGDCPKNMVLQTSCRCLRQVERGKAEEAVIWLNKFNADTLNAQLSKTQNTSVKELNAKVAEEPIQINRYSRMEVQKVPPIQFYQLKVTYNTLTTEESPDTQRRLEEDCLVERSSTLVSVQDLEGNITQTYAINPDQGAPITFREWLNTIAKESLGTLLLSDLKKYEIPLRSLYDRLTILLPDGCHYIERYDQERIRSLVRQAFVPRRDFNTREEVISTEASLLQIEKLTSPITTHQGDHRFHPDDATVQRILEDDKQPSTITPEMQQAIDTLKAAGMAVPDYMQGKESQPERRHTYHYLPYRFDSKLEREYLQDALSCIDDQPLEVYYNGDDTLTEFKIDCFKHNGRYWVRIGKYVPDFLILSRNAEGGIHKVIIAETKGEGFAAKFAERRKFMETQFIKQNNEKFGYRRFEFLYIEDTLKPEQRKQKLYDAINSFFNNNEEGGDV